MVWRIISYTKNAAAFAGTLLLRAGEKPLKNAATPSAAYSCTSIDVTLTAVA